MFTCCIRYTVDLSKIKDFEKYARLWIGLVEKHGGTHHGYFLPGSDADELPNSSFSFPDIGKNGPNNIALALFSFPNLEQYEAYKKAAAEDEKCKEATAIFTGTKCFLSYERNFLKPIFSGE
jgi:hypothetical protein